MVPRLRALATAVPGYVIDRETVAAIGKTLFHDDLDRLGPIYANAGIETRRSCVPPDWYLHDHGWAERTRIYGDNAVDLAARATLEALAGAGGLPLSAVDAVVAVSTTGICTPSLDALLIERLGLRPDVVRLPIFGLGCAGGTLGLARAAMLAKAMPGANVLLVVVELCGLTFRASDRSPANIVATALFGDGCAAALLSTKGDGAVIAAWGEHTWPNSLDVMGWRIEDDGFGVVFSRDIPSLILGQFGPALDGWLDREELNRTQIDGWAMHPGGAKVVSALEQVLHLPAGHLEDERAVLARYGNMSAATVLFVLRRRLERPLPRRLVSAAVGPGFSAGFVLLEGP